MKDKLKIKYMLQNGYSYFKSNSPNPYINVKVGDDDEVNLYYSFN